MQLAFMYSNWTIKAQGQGVQYVWRHQIKTLEISKVKLFFCLLCLLWIYFPDCSNVLLQIAKCKLGLFNIRIYSENKNGKLQWEFFDTKILYWKDNIISWRRLISKSYISLMIIKMMQCDERQERFATKKNIAPNFLEAFYLRI